MKTVIRHYQFSNCHSRWKDLYGENPCFRQVSAQEMEYCRMIAVIGVDLLEEITVTHRSHEHVIHSMVLLQLSVLTVLTGGGSCTTRSAATPTEVILQNTCHYIQRWIEGFQFGQIDWKAFRGVCIAYMIFNSRYLLHTYVLVWCDMLF